MSAAPRSTSSGNCSVWPRPNRRVRPTLYVVDGFVDAHRALTELFPTVVATFDGASRAAADRRRGNVVPHGRHRRPIFAITVAAPRRIAAGSAVRADDPRPAVPHVSRVLQPNQARLPRGDDRPIASDEARMVTVPSEYVRGIGDRGVRQSIRRRVAVVPHGFEPDLLHGHHRRGRAAPPVRPRRRPGDRLSRRDPSPQEPSLPDRSAGVDMA